MNLLINGKKTETNATNLAELITELKLQKASLIVEHNRTIIRQENWQETPLQENDNLELLNLVGGG